MDFFVSAHCSSAFSGAMCCICKVFLCATFCLCQSDCQMPIEKCLLNSTLDIYNVHVMGKSA